MAQKLLNVAQSRAPLEHVGRARMAQGVGRDAFADSGLQADAANDLIGFVADPNVAIQESKALSATIEAGRRSRAGRGTANLPVVTVVDERAWQRDIPSARKSGDGAHGHKTAESKEGN